MKTIKLIATSVALISFAFVAFKTNGTSQREKNVQTVKELFSAFNEHDWDRMVSFYAPDAILEDPSYEKPVVGTQGMKEKYNRLQQLFPDIRDEIQNIYVSRNHVIVEFVSTGTAQDGTSFTTNICSVISLKNGKIVRDATYYDL